MENLNEKIIKITIENKTEYIKNSLYKYLDNRDINNLTFEIDYIIKDEFIFFLGYLIDTKNKSSFSHAYFMLCSGIYGTDNLYENLSIICKKSYNLNNVILNTKNYFNSYSNQLNKIN